MAHFKGLIQQRIAAYEAEITRVQEQAVESVERLQADLAVLRRAEAFVTPQIEVLLHELGRMGVKVGD